MQQTQQRELPERISWARAIVLATGFFFISAILVGQLPSYVYIEMTAATLEGFQHGSLSLAVTCLASFTVIMVIMLLFDPKPVIAPRLVAGAGSVSALVGLALTVWATTTGCEPGVAFAANNCNQYFPKADMSIAPVLGGNLLWFHEGAVDFVMLGLAAIGVGLAMVFYGVLALREQTNPDRRDLGTTPTIRWMLTASSLLLAVFLVFYTYFYNAEFGTTFFAGHPFWGYKLIQLLIGIVLGTAVLLALGALLLRLHYLMRPIRKRVMPGLYMIGALGLAQTGAIFLLLWAAAYPLVAWAHTWDFIGLSAFMTKCARPSDVPGSCSFGSEFGYLVDAIITSSFFGALVLAIWAWKSHRHLVVIGSIVVIGVIGATALLVHTSIDKLPTAMMICAAILIMGAIWTATSRREFAVVGQNNLGCLGQWLVFGSCLTIYLASFALFSMVSFGEEAPPNIPFIPGSESDALVALILMGVLAAIQFYFLSRNRYRV